MYHTSRTPVTRTVTGPIKLSILTLRHKLQSLRPSSSLVVVVTVVWTFFVTLTVHASWVDPDTSAKYRTTKALTKGDTRDYRLIFSDEFEQDGRTFFDGNDPRWSAIHKNDYTNAALHYYSPDNARTSNGILNITTERKINMYKAFDEIKKEFYADKKYVQSGMLQSWNKFCFIGGIVEFSAKLPGDPQKGGLWPALWMLGNLARASYVGSSDFIWPYSYNKCDSKNRRSQEINACSVVNHYGLESFAGRGSPEIDILEAMQGEPDKLPNTFIHRPYQSASLQIAPGIEDDRPLLGKRPNPLHWYTDMEYSAMNHSDLNPFFYGVTLVHRQKSATYQSDALSANRQLNSTHYNSQHLYRVEWEPPAADGTGGYIKWFTDGELVFGLKGSTLDIMQTEIPSEPMYLIMNTAVSSSWGFPLPCPENCECKCFECGTPECECGLPSGYCDNFPASFEIDYVRVFQAVNEKRHILGCSPEHRPTDLFIKGHSKRYMSDGQKMPLKPIRRGGGECIKHFECGKRRGAGLCSSGFCICVNNFTGPYCLAHDGYYDFETTLEPSAFALREMIIPRSMMVTIALLAVAFVLLMLGTIRANAKRPKYQTISNSVTSSSNGIPIITSYQDSAAMYALPNNGEKQDVTFCVIDGRLVDSSR